MVYNYRDVIIKIFVLFQEIADTTIPQLVQGIRATMTAPDSGAAQMQLINAAQNMLPVLKLLFFVERNHLNSWFHHILGEIKCV